MVAPVLVDQRGQRRAEALFVRAALGRVDRVGVRVDGLGVRGRPLHGDFQRQRGVVGLGLEVDDVGVDEVGLLCLVDEGDVVAQAVRVAVRDLAVALDRVVRRAGLVARHLVARVDRVRTLVRQRDPQALVKERHLLEPLAQRLERELDRLEDLRVRVKDLQGAGFRRLFAAFEVGQRVAAVAERLPPRVALALDRRVHPPRQRVNDGHADAVEAAGDRVAAAAELAARVEDRHDDLDRRSPLGGVDVDGDTAPVVLHRHAAVGPQDDLDVRAVPGQRLVDRVVHHLVHQVVEAALARRTDVHTGTFADSFQAFEDGNVAGAIFVLAAVCLFVCHGGHSFSPTVSASATWATRPRGHTDAAAILPRDL